MLSESLIMIPNLVCLCERHVHNYSFGWLLVIFCFENVEWMEKGRKEKSRKEKCGK